MDQENVLRNMDLLSRGFLMLHMLLLFLFFMSGAYIMIVVSLITVLIVGVSLWFAKRIDWFYSKMSNCAISLRNDDDNINHRSADSAAQCDHFCFLM